MRFRAARRLFGEAHPQYPCGEDSTGPASAGLLFVLVPLCMPGATGLRPVAPALRYSRRTALRKNRRGRRSSQTLQLMAPLVLAFHLPLCRLSFATAMQRVEPSLSIIRGHLPCPPVRRGALALCCFASIGVRSGVRLHRVLAGQRDCLPARKTSMTLPARRDLASSGSHACRCRVSETEHCVGPLLASEQT